MFLFVHREEERKTDPHTIVFPLISPRGSGLKGGAQHGPPAVTGAPKSCAWEGPPRCFLLTSVSSPLRTAYSEHQVTGRLRGIPKVKKTQLPAQ